MSQDRRVEYCLAALRLSIGVFFLVWSLQKVLDPESAQRVFENFYVAIPAETAVLLIGIAQTAVVLAFMAGLFKTWTYGALTAMHAVSTLSTLERLANPYQPPNALFWAAVPVLAALVLLWVMRDRDTFLTVKLRGG